MTTSHQHVLSMFLAMDTDLDGYGSVIGVLMYGIFLPFFLKLLLGAPTNLSYHIKSGKT